MKARYRIPAALLVFVGVGCSAVGCAAQQLQSRAPGVEPHYRHEAVANGAPPAGPFVIDSQRSSGELLTQSMAIMSREMRQAPMSGDPDHDFASMMIPHHQGAIDMAKVEVLYGKDPVLRRLAQEIIVTQDSEIAVMKRQLQRNSSQRSVPR